jgi:hypothetical protein
VLPFGSTDASIQLCTTRKLTAAEIGASRREWKRANADRESLDAALPDRALRLLHRLLNGKDLPTDACPLESPVSIVQGPLSAGAPPADFLKRVPVPHQAAYQRALADVNVARQRAQARDVAVASKRNAVKAPLKALLDSLAARISQVSGAAAVGPDLEAARPFASRAVGGDTLADAVSLLTLLGGSRYRDLVAGDSLNLGRVADGIRSLQTVVRQAAEDSVATERAREDLRQLAAEMIGDLVETIDRDAEIRQPPAGWPNVAAGPPTPSTT